jgi:putative flippase GtrA
MRSRLFEMQKRISDFRAWSTTHQGKKLIRYTFSSVITTGVSLSAILIVYGFHIINGVIGATLFGNVVAIVPSYYLNRAWAWGKRGKSHFRHEVVPYWSMAFLGIAFSLLGAAWVKHLVHTHQWGHLVDTGLVAGVNLLCFAVFWILKMLVFNRIFHTDKLHDIDEHLVAEEHTTT